MLKVFVSSTSVDLIAHRKAVGDAIRAIKMAAVMMEDFTATDDDAVNLCRKATEESDLFVGIYAHRYGFMPPEYDKSITEMEYDWASAAKIPRFLFFLDDGYPWDDDFRDANDAPLKAFRARVESEKVRKLFTTPDNLASKVSAALSNYERETGLLPKQELAFVEREHRQGSLFGAQVLLWAYCWYSSLGRFYWRRQSQATMSAKGQIA